MTLEVDGLTHRYGDEVAVRDVSFGLEAGELVTLLGPSGCGKTTVVQAIAGHLRPTAGRVRLRGVDVTGDPPESRRVGLVFQQPTLFPHMTVRENVAYGLDARGVAPEERDDRVAEYLDLVSLDGKHDSLPAALSGGEKRRAELARALAPQPDLLVLDEPLSALDRALREQLREEIARIHRETGVTTLFVTHDQEEAIALSDRLVVMNEGRVAGIGGPRALYESPPTPFVAAFLGRSNIFPATVRDQDPLALAFANQNLVLDGRAGEHPPGRTVSCHVRPKDLSLCPPREGSLTGEVTRVADIGRRYDVTVEVGTDDSLVVEHTAEPPTAGETVGVALPADAPTLFDGVEASERATVGNST